MFRIIRRKKIQPIDLKKELTIAMREERRVLPYGDYAPNHYVILLNKEDARRWSALKNRAIEQLKTFLLEQIDKENYQLEGDISIEIQESEDLEPGDVSVEADLEVTRTCQQTVPSDETYSTTNTEGFPSIPLDDEPIEGEDLEDVTFLLPRTRPIAKLIVSKGEDAPREFDIYKSTSADKTRVVVGRRGKKADISLTDSSRYISRRQFEIVYDEGTFTLTDLQNRTDLHVFVNDNKAAPSMILNTKDKIRLGNARMTVVEMEFIVLSR